VLISLLFKIKRESYASGSATKLQNVKAVKVMKTELEVSTKV